MNSGDYAEPGDTDLSCDIEGTVVTSVVLLDNKEMMIVLEGGHGFIVENGKQLHWDRVARLELNFGYETDSEGLAFMSMMADRLEAWREAKSELRLLSAHGRMTTLVLDRNDWLPIPCGAIGT